MDGCLRAESGIARSSRVIHEKREQSREKAKTDMTSLVPSDEGWKTEGKVPFPSFLWKLAKKLLLLLLFLFFFPPFSFLFLLFFVCDRKKRSRGGEKVVRFPERVRRRVEHSEAKEV